MRQRIAGGVLAVIVGLLPAGAVAQPITQPAQNTHTRAGSGSATLTLANVRLFVPAGSTAPGAMIGLGVGGVPAKDGLIGPTGIVVTAAGGLRGAVVALIAPSAVDRAGVGAATPALLDTTDGGAAACLDTGTWLACPVGRPGAYVLGPTAVPAPDGAALRDALAHLPASESPRPSAARIITVVLAAALAGAAAALLLAPGQRAKDAA